MRRFRPLSSAISRSSMATVTGDAEAASIISRRFGENPPLFVQRKEAGDPARHAGLLIGNIGDQYLVLGGFTDVEMSAGEKIVLRTVLDNHLVGFETQVKFKIDQPRMYIVTFPAKIETINLRKAHRIQAFFPADAQVSGAGDDGNVLLLKTRVLDISGGGCSFRSKTRLQAESQVTLNFSLPGDRRIQSVRGTLLDSQAVGAVYHSRIKFSQDAANVPILSEITKWVGESLTFTEET
jgi:hypothetical protein